MPINKTKGNRQLKISKKYFQRKLNAFKIFPEINLAGKWLREIGFDCGKFVTVKFQKNKIVITVKEGNG